MNLIVGTSGLIGKYLARTNAYYGTSRNPSGSREIFLDLHSPERFDYGLVGSGSNVIILAAVSSPALCVSDFESSYATNVTGTIYFIDRCLQNGAKVLFFSSDTVYGNSVSKVDEKSKPSPVGMYAGMKHKVEKQFLGRDDFKSARLSYVLSGNDRFINYLNTCRIEKKTAEIFEPFQRSVVYVNDVLDAVDRLFLEWSNFTSSILNIVGPNLVSRVAITECYSRHCSGQLRFEVCEPPSNFWEERPKIINAASLHLSDLIQRPAVPVDEALRKILEF